MKLGRRAPRRTRSVGTLEAGEATTTVADGGTGQCQIQLAQASGQRSARRA